MITLLAIDPSILETGYAVLYGEDVKHVGTIKTKSKDNINKRLHEIADDIQTLCAQHHPVALAIETQYLDVKNRGNSVLKTAETKGVMKAAFWSAIPHGKVFDIHPMEAKKFLYRYGSRQRKEAKKSAVLYVNMFYPDLLVKNHNIADAILIGLACNKKILLKNT